MAATKKKTVELKEGTLVIVYEGLKKAQAGPYKGENMVGSMKVYIGEEQVGALQRFKLEASATEPLPRLEFDFGEQPPATLKGFPTLKAMYEKAITRIREFFPWAKYTSPVGSSPPEVPPDPTGR